MLSALFEAEILAKKPRTCSRANGDFKRRAAARRSAKRRAEKNVRGPEIAFRYQIGRGRLSEDSPKSKDEGETKLFRSEKGASHFTPRATAIGASGQGRSRMACALRICETRALDSRIGQRAHVMRHCHNLSDNWAKNVCPS